MNKEKDFFKTCLNIVAGLEVKNESQAIAKEVVLNEVENLQEENKQLKDNWNKLKEDLINDINYWQEQEKQWIKLGFIKFGGEANNKIIFKKVLNKMQELEQGSDE